MAVQATIHSPFTIGSFRLKNRLVALPVFTGYAYPDGGVSSLLLSHYSRLAASGVAMVVVANTAVSADGVTSRYNLRIDDDRFVPGLETLAGAIHRQGALACLQLNHAGRFAKAEQPLLASPVAAANLTYNVTALKDFINSFPFEQRFGLTGLFLRMIAGWHRAVSDGELHRVVTDFCQAACRAQQAGFDMIELHGANGYLLCDFFSPATNKRTSGFGGNLENRMTLPLTVVCEIQRSLPAPIPLGFRLLLHEWVPGGIEPPEAIALAKALEKAGVSYISVASGTFNSMFKPQVAEKMAVDAYLRDASAELQRQVTIPAIISGRVTTPALANQLLAQQTADLIGLGRALRVDPNWVRKSLRSGSKIKRCINCNTCLKSVILEQGFMCRRWTTAKKLETELHHHLLTRNYKGLWVICDQKDLKCFKAGLHALLLAFPRLQSEYETTVLFISNETSAACSPEERAEFIVWIQAQAVVRGNRTNVPAVKEAIFQGDWSQAIREEADRGDFGMVLVSRDRSQFWRRRLLYALHHKVVGLINPNARMNHVAVLIDFSASSLLILNFLHHAFGSRPDATMEFIHACASDNVRIHKRWKDLKKAAGLRIDAPLKWVPSSGNVTAALIDEIAVGPYGTIIMGKRGLSGIKRLLLGSVSRAVLRSTDDHSLFLVD